MNEGCVVCLYLIRRDSLPEDTSFLHGISLDIDRASRGERSGVLGSSVIGPLNTLPA
jgi:hypothetical protein